MFAAALVLRLAYLWSWHDSALFSTPVGDSRAYLDWAHQIAAGDWLGRDVFYQAPLYPYLLGALEALFGPSLWAVRIAQSLLGSLSCAALTWSGGRFFSRRIGILAGLALALYPPALWFDGLIQKATLDASLLALLTCAFAELADRDRPIVALAAGALLGLLALSRENALVLAPVVALFAPTTGPPRSPARRALALGALALGLALPLVPVGLRNQSLGGRFLLTTYNLGPNLWIGNHPGASGRYEALRPGRGNAVFERGDARALAEQARGHTLSPAEVSDYWRDRALEFARANPAEFLAGLAHKWALVWNDAELPDTEGIGAYREASPLLAVLDAVYGFGLLAPLALVTAVSRRADWRRIWVLWASAVVLGASVALFFVFARFRYSLVPLLALLAAAGATDLAGAWRARQLRRLAGLVAAGSLGALFAHLPLVAPTDVGLTHYSVGSALLESGKLREARAELERAVAALPDSPMASVRYSDVLRETGEPARALALCDAVLARAPDLADAHVSRALALEALGRPAEARAALERAVAIDPLNGDAHDDLGNLLVAERRWSEALAQYRLALAERPDDANFEANYGAGLLGAGRLDESLAHLDRALRLQPGHPSARLNRAYALEGLGRAGEARAEYASLLRDQPLGSDLAARAREGLARLGPP